MAHWHAKASPTRWFIADARAIPWHILRTYKTWAIRHVYITGDRADLISAPVRHLAGTHLRVRAGAMLDALETLARRHQLALFVELFSSSSGVLHPEHEQAFEVELIDTGKTYRVPPDKTLLHVLQEHGVDVPNDCEEGLCGSCEVVVLAGNVDHRDKVLTPAERAANTRMMTCCSRARGPLKIKL